MILHSYHENATHTINPYSHSYRNQKNVSLSSTEANSTMIDISQQR